MPYIRKELRSLLDHKIRVLAQEIIVDADDATRAGMMNYAITSLILEVYGKENLRYFQHNEIMGFLECAKQEFYRRATAPYEDKKIKSDGDVY